MYQAYITKLKNVRPHPNADRMLLADCFGNTVCVGLNAQEGDVVIYFPTDGQLSKAYAELNNLVRIKNEDGTYSGGYLDPDKRNIKAIKLRGEKSDGLTMPLSSLDAFGDTSALKVGDTISVFNGHEICKKYIPRGRIGINTASTGNKTRKKKSAPLAPLFAEHADTAQLAYNLDAFREGDEIEITLKMHGTSQRTGYLPKFKKFKRTLKDILFRKEGTPIYDWGYIHGTRRTVMADFEGLTSFYGSNKFREPHAKMFEGKLHKGETVYYEIVGFTDNGTPIMGTCVNKKTNDKEFIKKYGEVTTFSYGCESPQSALYVYRMTMTNEDGHVMELTPDYMRYRCEQMGVECCPLLAKARIRKEGIIVDDCYGESYGVPYEGSIGETLKMISEKYYDGPDPIGKNHVREGVVVRVVNRPKFTAFKDKNFYFKVLEGIIKDTSEVPDIEEAQEEINSEV